jgi:hypothetical protein
LKTCDSGVSATFQTTEGHNQVMFGILQQILIVNVFGRKEMLLVVNWYKEAVPSPNVSGTWLVKTGGRYPFVASLESTIAASKVDGQVFYAPDPSKAGYSHVFAYRGSSYTVPEHHYSPDGRVLDLGFLRPQAAPIQ